MSEVWIWLIIISLLAAITGIYIAMKPVIQRKLWGILALELFLSLIFWRILLVLPINVLYALTLASTPLLVLTFLVLTALGKRYRAAVQAQDQALEQALSIRVLLSCSLGLFTMACIFTLLQRSPNIQYAASLVQAVFVALLAFLAGFRGVTASRKSTRSYALNFIVSLALIALAIWILYLFARNIFHLL